MKMDKKYIVIAETFEALRKEFFRNLQEDNADGWVHITENETVLYVQNNIKEYESGDFTGYEPKNNNWDEDYTFIQKEIKIGDVRLIHCIMGHRDEFFKKGVKK